MIELLKPIFHGPLAPYGEGLICSATHSPGTVRLAELLGAPGTINTMLSRQAFHLGTSDLRPVASAWMLKYTALLLPPVAAAATLLKHVFPVDAREVAIELDHKGSPRRAFIPHLGRSAPGQDTVSRYAPLIDTHLAPLITYLSEASNLPAKILWGTVARRLDTILNQATTMMLAADLTAEIRTDRDYLLQRRTWLHGQRNPLFGRQQTVLEKHPDGRQTPILLHRQCCLYYLLPGEDYCRACPLSLRFRAPESENR